MNLPPLVEATETLDRAELERYSRHILLPEFGIKKQEMLKSSKVLVIGAGGLGSPVLMYLAAAGIGSIGIVDFDVVDASNLHRQIIHGKSDLGVLKTKSAVESMSEINPHIDIHVHDCRLDATNILDIFSQYDLVLDGTDNFPTRYLVNDACVMLNKPYVWGSIYRFEGQVSVFWEKPSTGKGFNYRDLYAEPPPPEFAPSCSEGGVLGVLCAVIGSIMATEAVKLLTGSGDALLGRLLVYDALDMNFRILPIRKDKEEALVIDELVELQEFCSLGGVNQDIEGINVFELKKMIDEKQNFKLIDVREQAELDLVKVSESIHIPRDELPNRALADIQKNEPIVVMCKGGARSRAAAELLKDQGFSDVKNLEGGILAWIEEINPQLPRY